MPRFSRRVVQAIDKGRAVHRYAVMVRDLRRRQRPNERRALVPSDPRFFGVWRLYDEDESCAKPDIPYYAAFTRSRPAPRARGVTRISTSRLSLVRNVASRSSENSLSRPFRIFDTFG